MTARPRLNTLWVEGTLGYLEQVCLVSALAHDHPVTLYTYFGVEAVPAGIEVRDAREIMPEDQLVKNKARNSWSLGSNLFRYHLMRHDRGVWIDADVYFLQPLDLHGRHHLFGWQKEGLVNGAIFYTVPQSRLIDGLFDYLGQEHIVPYWMPWRQRVLYELRPRLGLRPLTLGEHRWGVAGPRAITWVAGKQGLLEEALPVDVFYPYGPKRAREAFDPAVDIMAYTTERTITVHLWNEEVKPLKAAPPPPGSFMAQICARHGVATGG